MQFLIFFDFCKHFAPLLNCPDDQQIYPPINFCQIFEMSDLTADLCYLFLLLDQVKIASYLLIEFEICVILFMRLIAQEQDLLIPDIILNTKEAKEQMKQSSKPHQLMLNSLQQLLNVSKESKDNKLKKTKNNSVAGLSDPQNKRFKTVLQQIQRIIAKNNTFEKQTQKNILDLLGVALKNKQKTINFNLIKEKGIQEQLRMQYNDICNNICEMSHTLQQIKQYIKSTATSNVQIAQIVKYNEIKKTELQQFISQFASFKNESIQITLNLTPNSKNKDADKLTFDVSKMRQMYLTLKQCDKMLNSNQNKTNKANEWWGKSIIEPIQQLIKENKAGKEKQSKLNQQIKQAEDSNKQYNTFLKAVINNLSGYAYSQFNQEIRYFDKQLQQGLIKIKKELEGSSDLSKIIYRQIITYMNDSVFNEGQQQFSTIQTMNNASKILTIINQKRLPQIKRMFNKMKNVTEDYEKCTCINKKKQYKNKTTVNKSNSYINNFNNTVKSTISQNLTSSRAKSQSSNQNTEIIELRIEQYNQLRSNWLQFCRIVIPNKIDQTKYSEFNKFQKYKQQGELMFKQIYQWQSKIKQAQNKIDTLQNTINKRAQNDYVVEQNNNKQEQSNKLKQQIKQLQAKVKQQENKNKSYLSLNTELNSRVKYTDQIKKQLSTMTTQKYNLMKLNEEQSKAIKQLQITLSIKQQAINNNKKQIKQYMAELNEVQKLRQELQTIKKQKINSQKTDMDQSHNSTTFNVNQLHNQTSPPSTNQQNNIVNHYQSEIAKMIEDFNIRMQQLTTINNELIQTNNLSTQQIQVKTKQLQAINKQIEQAKRQSLTKNQINLNLIKQNGILQKQIQNLKKQIQEIHKFSLTCKQNDQKNITSNKNLLQEKQKQLNSIQNQLSSQKIKNTQLQSQINKLTIALSANKQSHLIIQGQKNELNKQLNKQKQCTKNLQSKLIDLQNALQINSSSSTQSNEQMQNLKDQLKHQVSEKEQRIKDITDLKQRQSTLQSKVKELEASKKISQQQCNKQIQEIQAIKEMLNCQKIAKQQLEKNKSNLSKQIQELQKQKQASKAQIKRINYQICKKSDQFSKLQMQSINKQTQMLDLLDKIDAWKEQQAKYKQESNKSKQSIASLTQQNSKLECQNKAKQQTIQNQLQSIQTINRELNCYQQSVRSMVQLAINQSSNNNKSQNKTLSGNQSLQELTKLHSDAIKLFAPNLNSTMKESIDKNKGNDQIKKKDQQLRSSKREIDSLNNKIQNLQKINKLQTGKLTQSNNKLTQSNDKLTKANSRANELQQKISEKQKIITELNNRITCLQSRQIGPNSITQNSPFYSKQFIKYVDLYNLDILKVAHYNSLFQGQLITQQFKIKKMLVSHIENLMKKQICKTQLLCKYDPYNETNFHSYIDNKSSILCVIKTAGGVYLAGYYSGEYQSKQPMISPGILISLKNDESYKLKAPGNNPNQRTTTFRGMVWDEFFLIFGNAELRMRHKDKNILSNFAAAAGYFNPQGRTVNDFLGCQNRTVTEYEAFQIYQIHFNEQKEEEEKREIE